MPIQVERSIDDPIVTFRLEGPLNPETIQEVKDQTTQLLNELGTFYAIIDLEAIETTFGEALALLEISKKSTSNTEPRIDYVFVGQPVHNDPTNQSGVPVFENTGLAFEYIRQEIVSKYQNR